MGLVEKTKMAKYWSTNSLTRTPFFGKILSRNTFQNILVNLYISDNNTDYPHDNPNHDPLHKVRPFIQMCERTFQLVYRPGCDFSFEEACCPFKGRVQFCVYNANKLAKIHMKLFQICEAKSGYICALDIYTGKDQTRCIQTAQVLDPSCTTTSILVVGLMDSVHLLDKGHCMYMENFYTSPELYEELFFHFTYACGTVCQNRKGLPKAVTTPKPKKTEDVFRCNDPLLAIKKCDKRAVTILTTIHAAIHVATYKTDAWGDRILKPLAIVDYINKMGGCDTSDQLMSYYTFLWKSIKWWKKLFIHLLNMLLLNAHILNSKYGCKKLYHQAYMEYIANYLITEGSVNCSLKRPPVQCHSSQNDTQGTVAKPMDLHLPQLIPRTEGSKRKPSRPCFACNGSWSDIWAKRIPKRCTGIWCGTCKKPLCISSCFKIFHTEENYKAILLAKRLST